MSARYVVPGARWVRRWFRRYVRFATFNARQLARTDSREIRGKR